MENIYRERVTNRCRLEQQYRTETSLADKNEIATFLKSLHPFVNLSDKELDYIAGQSHFQKFPRGKYLAVQNATTLSSLFVIRSGILAVFIGHGENSIEVGTLSTGEVYGSISILLNNGISLRSAKAYEELEVLSVPQEVIVEICRCNREFSSQIVLNVTISPADAELDPLINSGLVKLYLSNVHPFSTLPDDALARVEKHLSLVHYPQGSSLFAEGKNKIGYLYLMYKGTATVCSKCEGMIVYERFLEEDDLFGGRAMLSNNSLTHQSLLMTDDAYFYLLPEKIFLTLCRQYHTFKESFKKTDCSS